MRVLVTGGSGTIGPYVLRELLAAGHAVTCYSRQTPPLVEGAGFVAGDIMDAERLAAACRGHEKIVAWLIEKKAKVNADGGGGWTPLHLAAERGHLGVVKLLVKHGAKTTAKTEPVAEYVGILPSSPPGATPVKLPAVPARTPLDVAREAKQEKVVEYLKPLTK